MRERLQKLLSQAGIASRRQAETMITAGRVAVNGEVVTELGTKADPDHDMIVVDGRPLTVTAGKRYILLYKPSGYMTTLKDPEGRPLVIDLLKGIGERVYPVGRLDYNSEGLLLLTNDGEWANRLAHPRYEIDKEYHVRVQGQVMPEQVARLSAGVTLEDGRTAPATVAVLKESEQNTWISVTIHEGRYRQVRRMCEAVGLSVVRLRRNRYGFLNLAGLNPGEFRELTAEEARRLAEDPRAAAPQAKPVKHFHREDAKDTKKTGYTAARSTEMRKPGDRHIRRKI
jgi:23S rRNA pseudouridine2605 synthase